MFVIGITGCIGAGKSSAAKIFADKGVRVLDADEISRKVTGPNGSSVEAIRELLGNKVVDASGSLNRRQVAGIVFANRTKLDRMSEIIHRQVLEEIAGELEKERQKGTKVIVLDVPIPVKKGFLDVCNQVWVVSADEDVRLERLKDRGVDPEDAKRRMAMQMTREEYEDLADIVIVNNDGSDELKEKVESLIIQELGKRGIRV
jgi:dephospho-CoA kinase